MPRKPEDVLAGRIERLKPGQFMRTSVPFHRLSLALEKLSGKGLETETYPCANGYMIRLKSSDRCLSIR